LLFYLASIIIHGEIPCTKLIIDLFNTSHTDPNVSETSSYLDLAPLYGSNEDQQKTVRTFADGKLKADCFYDARILGFPPGVGVLLVCFNRYHNYIVDEMAQINEHGRFSQPNLDAIKVNVRAVNPKWTDAQISQEAQKKYDTYVTKRDENLFQTARL
jgi:hypothetical protein